MSHRDPKDMLEYMVETCSRRNCKKIATTIADHLETYLRVQQRWPGSHLTLAFEYGGDICNIIFVYLPPFDVPLKNRRPRLYINSPDPALIARSSSDPIADFLTSFTLVMELNETSFVWLTDRRDFIAVTYTAERSDRWVLVPDVRPRWRHVVAENARRLAKIIPAFGGSRPRDDS